MLLKKIIGSLNLNPGDNKFTIYAVNEFDEEGTKYIINVFREELSNDNSLKQAEVDGEIILGSEFVNNTFIFEKGIFTVDQVILFKAFANNEFATVEVLTTNNDSNITLVHGINTIEFKIIAQDGTENFFKVIIDTKSNANSILDITVVGYENEFIFETTKTVYELKVKATVLSLELDVVASEYARVVIEGNNDFKYGFNKVVIYAINEFDEVGTKYEINVYRASSNTDLDQILIDDTELEFELIDNTYIVKLPYRDGMNVDIDFIVENDRTVSGSGYFALSHGINNVFFAVVTAEDGTKEEYRLIINALYDINEITDITINELAIGFNKDVSKYSYKVDYRVRSINIEARAIYNGTVTVEINDDIIPVFMNNDNNEYILLSNETSFSVYSTSEFGTKGPEYIVTVTRVQLEENDNHIKDILVKGYGLSSKFSNDQKKYIVKVANSVTKVDISVVKGYEEQEVIISENSNDLQVGDNVIKISVKSEDKQMINEFEVIINRKASNNWIILWILLILVVAYIIYKLLFSKKNKRKTYGKVFLVKVTKRK